MKLVICPDSFKGSLSALEVAEAVKSAAGDADAVLIPAADGGEGTVDALLASCGGRKRVVEVHAPDQRIIRASYGVLADGQTAVIEMAAASGLYLLPPQQRNPLYTTSYGTGELIKAAITAGARKLIIGIGGSATNDGGAGMLAALGIRFLDANGHQLGAGGAELHRLCSIDTSEFLLNHTQIDIEVACDVTNPLCGAHGASAVYGPQKGATAEMVETLDAALAHYAAVIKRDIGIDVIDLPGSGAAGGLGAGFAAFTNAKLRSGIDIVLDVAHFDQHLADADLVITGEGRIDEQTLNGKVISGILARSRSRKVPVVAIAGSVAGNIEALFNAGLTAAFSITSGPMSLDYAMEHTYELVQVCSRNIMRLYSSRSN